MKINEDSENSIRSKLNKNIYNVFIYFINFTYI